jgi:hypothetical protein
LGVFLFLMFINRQSCPFHCGGVDRQIEAGAVRTDQIGIANSQFIATLPPTLGHSVEVVLQASSAPRRSIRELTPYYGVCTIINEVPLEVTGDDCT